MSSRPAELIAHVHVFCLPVGPYQANCYLIIPGGDAKTLVVDPGDEAYRILTEIDARELEPVAVLVTHGHPDHVGAVDAVASRSSARVYMPALEAHLLPGREADVLVHGGEQLELAGTTVEVLAVPGHSPGHVAYRIGDLLASGDVLFADSVGRTDLPGSDPAALDRTLRELIEGLPPQTLVLPGHGPATTLERERATNPFLAALRDA